MKKLNEQTKIKIYSVDTNAPVCPKIKKKDDTKIFEIKKLNNVWADVSVRLKQNKNNIITFDKHCRGRRPRRPEKIKLKEYFKLERRKEHDL